MRGCCIYSSIAEGVRVNVRVRVRVGARVRAKIRVRVRVRVGYLPQGLSEHVVHDEHHHRRVPIPHLRVPCMRVPCMPVPILHLAAWYRVRSRGVAPQHGPGLGLGVTVPHLTECLVRVRRVYQSP